LDYSGQTGIDLHIHSTASDGTLTPREIVSMALDLHLGAIAITDHDTIDGAREALAQGVPPSLQFVPGVEISATPFFEDSPDSSYHILGYFIDLNDPALNQLLTKLQTARSGRNPEIIKQLQAIGFDISLDDVKHAADGGQVGRPHIAQVMLKKGYVDTIDHAFNAYLSKGQSAYVDKFRIDCHGAIDIIKGAGGIPVLAHPGLLSMENDDDFDSLVASLKDAGLLGLEVLYPEHTAEQIARFTEMAGTHDLLITGGTDFHGELKPEISMGTGDGSLFVPFPLFEALLAQKNHGSSWHAQEVQLALGYTFQRPELLQEALSHSSFVNEQSDRNRRDNERFEFLGDAVLNLVVGDLLMQYDPELREGDLTRIRSAMVNEQQLASLSRSIDLGKHILLGIGESRTGGEDKSSILADCLEAVIAAIYLDGGFAASFDFIQRHFSPLIQLLVSKINAQDYKSELQEFVQSRHHPGPSYTLCDESGPDHDKTFRIQLETCGIRTCGMGKSKKAAEQDAARIALQILRQASCLK
jgi:ribonuclease III